MNIWTLNVQPKEFLLTEHATVNHHLDQAKEYHKNQRILPHVSLSKSNHHFAVYHNSLGWLLTFQWMEWYNVHSCVSDFFCIILCMWDNIFCDADLVAMNSVNFSFSLTIFNSP